MTREIYQYVRCSGTPESHSGLVDWVDFRPDSYMLPWDSIDRALSRSPVVTGDFVRVVHKTALSDMLGTSYDSMGTVGYVYYNGFAGVALDTGDYVVERWHNISVASTQ